MKYNPTNQEAVTAEAERLVVMADEALTINLQDASRNDHILAAETLLSVYEQSFNIQAQVAVAAGQEFTLDDEGSLLIFRLAAETHLKIAEALR